MQVLVGDHVEGFTGRLEPVDHVGIGVERPGDRFGFHVENGPQPRREVHAAAVGVVLIERVAHLRMVQQISILWIVRFSVAHYPAGEAEPLIGVGKIRRRRGEIGHLVLLLLPGRSHKKGHVIF